MKEIKNIALVAHDNRKPDLIEWIEWNWNVLINHKLICTGTTGKLIKETLVNHIEKNMKLNIKILKSGPLGGDQQLGALIADEKVDILIFLWDPMQSQPHDVDVKALLRISALYNIPTACNRATADFVISSHLFNEEYHQVLKDYSKYLNRKIDL